MARVKRVLQYLLIVNLLVSVSYAAEVIKAEPIFNNTPVIRPQIVAPPSKPLQTEPSINYVPKVNNTNTTVVPNTNLKISAPNTQTTTVTSSTSKTGTVTVKPVANTSPVVAPRPPVAQPASPVEPQMMSFKQCTKIFGTESERLFYIAIAAINANNFKIVEIQSRSAYIIFKAANREFLLSVAGIDKTNSIVKITPVNNNYFFPSGVVSNIFKYIDLNLSMPITKID